MRALALTSLIAALAWTPAAAQEPGGRYRMVPTADGFLEIDSRTGAVSACKRAGDGYRCEPASREKDGAQAEIDRLAKENAELKERLARSSPPPGPDAKPPRRSLAPSDEEIDRALGMMEKFLRRFMTILREEKSDRI